MTDTDHRKLRKMMVQTSVKSFFSKWMDKYSLSHTPHITRFLKLQKENVPGLNDSELHGVNYVSIKEKTGKDAEELLNLCTLT